MFGKGFSSLDGKERKPLLHGDVFTRGKHQGESFDNVLASDPKYIVFVYESTNDHGMTPKQHKWAVLAVEQKDEEAHDDPYAKHGGSYNDFWSADK